MQSTQNICPICTETFKKGETVIQYLTWNGNGKESLEKPGHLDCVFYLSREEKRKHPPQ